MSVLGFTGYAGGLPQLLDDCGVPLSLFQKRAMKRGVLHVGGSHNAKHRQYAYSTFVHKIVKQAVNNGAIRLMYVIVENTQGYNGSKLPCAAIVGTECDVLEWVRDLNIRHPHIGIYGYHMDPYSLREVDASPRHVKAYLDIDMVADEKDGFADVWPDIQTAIDIANASLELDVETQAENTSEYPLDVSLCYNNRWKENRNYFSFRVIWNNHAFKSQDDQKGFFNGCFPPGFAPFVDRKVWTNGRVMRMPYCGKGGNRDAMMTPITVQKAGDTWSYTKDTTGHLTEELFTRFNICTYEWDQFANKNFYHSCSTKTQKKVSVTQIGGFTDKNNVLEAHHAINDAIWAFFKNLMQSLIIPAIQVHRSQLRRRIAPDSEGGVPTTRILTTTVKRDPFKAGVFTYKVKNDSFCEYDSDGKTPYTHSAKQTTIQLDLTIGAYFSKCYCKGNHYNKYQLFDPNTIAVRTYNNAESSYVLELTKEGAVAMYLRYWADDIIFNPVKHCEFFIYSESIGMWVHDDNLLTSKKMQFLSLYRGYRLAVYDAGKDERVSRIEGGSMSPSKMEKALAKLEKERKYIQTQLNPFVQSPDAFKKEAHTQFEYVIGYSNADLDIYPHLVPMKNGTCYNVLDGSTVTLKKDMHITSCMNAVMKSTFDEECRIVAAWFLEISCGRHDLARYIKLVAALCFTMLKIDRKFYCNLGVEGRNGKSVFFSLLQVHTHTHTTTF